MSAWLDNVVARAQQSPATHAQLADIQQASLAELKNTAWPTRKTEAWKYTSLYALSQQAFTGDASIDEVAAEPIEGLLSLDICFANNQWDLSKLPAQLPQGLQLGLLSDEAVLPKNFNQIKPSKHLFGRINDSLMADVLVIKVAAEADIEQVLRLSLDNSGGSEQHARFFVELEEGAKFTLVEQLSGKAKALSNLFAEYDIAANAHLTHYRLQLQTAESFCFGGCHFKLADHAQMTSNIVGFGSETSRLDVDVEHAGSHAFAKMNAVYLLDGQEHFDLHTTIEHAVPHGTTDENVRGIVADQAQAVFNGRIHIHRDAQKTLAELNNRNLLLSRKAEINTKPELEIYADDVRCAHGATVAEIDQSAVYYLTSRGISKADALIMLNFGFINELVDQMPHEAIAKWLRPQLRERFANMKPE